MYNLISTKSRDVQIKFRGKSFTKTNICYTYASKDGSKLSFEAHPTKAWQWNINKSESNDLGIKNATKIIEFHCEQLLKGEQHEQTI